MAFRPQPDNEGRPLSRAVRPSCAAAYAPQNIMSSLRRNILYCRAAPSSVLPRFAFPNTSIAGSSRRRRPQPKACIGALPVFAPPPGKRAGSCDAAVPGHTSNGPGMTTPAAQQSSSSPTSTALSLRLRFCFPFRRPPMTSPAPYRGTGDGKSWRLGLHDLP